MVPNERDVEEGKNRSVIDVGILIGRRLRLRSFFLLKYGPEFAFQPEKKL